MRCGLRAPGTGRVAPQIPVQMPNRAGMRGMRGCQGALERGGGGSSCPSGGWQGGRGGGMMPGWAEGAPVAGAGRSLLPAEFGVELRAAEVNCRGHHPGCALLPARPPRPGKAPVTAGASTFHCLLITNYRAHAALYAQCRLFSRKRINCMMDKPKRIQEWKEQKSVGPYGLAGSDRMQPRVTTALQPPPSQARAVCLDPTSFFISIYLGFF